MKKWSYIPSISMLMSKTGNTCGLSKATHGKKAEGVPKQRCLMSGLINSSQQVRCIIGMGLLLSKCANIMMQDRRAFICN